MPDQFSRAAALYGSENIDKLKRCRVAVFGLGGVGGNCAEALCRSGIGAIDLFDADVVEITNINRQAVAAHSTIGRDKVEVMRERLLDINPDAVITSHKIFYLPATADEVDLSVFDYIIDAVDTIAAKLELVCRAGLLSVPVISSMGTANKFDPAAIEVADVFNTSVCPIARIMRGELRKRGLSALKVVYSKEKPVGQGDGAGQGDGSSVLQSRTDEPSPCPAPSPCPTLASNAFVPPVAGLIMAAEVVRYLTSV